MYSDTVSRQNLMEDRASMAGCDPANDNTCRETIIEDRRKMMKRISLITLSLAAAAMLAACGAPAGNAPANNVNTNANSTKPTAAAPTKEALMTLEKSGWEAWKTRDAKWTEENYTDKGLNLGAIGRTDKAAMIKSTETQKCEIKSYALTDDNMHMAGPDAAFLTFKAAQDATCDGKKLPAAVYSVSVYVREGDKWKAAFYSEAPVVDPKASPAKPAAADPADAKKADAKQDEAKKDEAKPAETKPDAGIGALMAVETKAWESWKNKDAKGLDEFAGKDMVSLSATEGWTDREASIKRWTTDPCEIKAVSLTDPASMSLGGDYSLLTFKSSVDGKCGGQNVPSEWGATIYGKENGVWKALMTFGTPAA